MSGPNIERPEFDDDREAPGFTRQRARIGRQAGTEKIGLSLFEVLPGEAAYPYHWHFGEEELLIVLAGTPSLRTPAGWRDLEQGEVVSFLVGEDGAHQIANRTREPVRFLAFSNQVHDIVVYPDSDKVGTFERRPEGGGLFALFRREDSVDYLEGEEPPSTP